MLEFKGYTMEEKGQLLRVVNSKQIKAMWHYDSVALKTKTASIPCKEIPPSLRRLNQGRLIAKSLEAFINSTRCRDWRWLTQWEFEQGRGSPAIWIIKEGGRKCCGLCKLRKPVGCGLPAWALGKTYTITNLGDPQNNRHMKWLLNAWSHLLQ